MSGRHRTELIGREIVGTGERAKIVSYYRVVQIGLLGTDRAVALARARTVRRHLEADPAAVTTTAISLSIHWSGNLPAALSCAAQCISSLAPFIALRCGPTRLAFRLSRHPAPGGPTVLDARERKGSEPFPGDSKCDRNGFQSFGAVLSMSSHHRAD